MWSAPSAAPAVLVEHCNLHVDLPRGVEVGWTPLLALIGSQQLYEGCRDIVDEEAVIGFLVDDERNPGSIAASISRARENLRTSRSVVPPEAWEVLNSLHAHVVDHSADALDRRTRFAYLRRIVRDSQMLTGLLATTMSHDEAYAFGGLGRSLERADMTSRVLDVRAETLLPEIRGGYRPYDNVQWMGVLRSVGAHQMYRRSVGPKVRASAAVRFLLSDDDFPRSVSHCLYQIAQFAKKLPHHDEVLDATSDVLLLVHGTPVPSSLPRAPEAIAAVLHDVVDRTQYALTLVHDAIERSYLEPRTAGPQLRRVSVLGPARANAVNPRPHPPPAVVPYDEWRDATGTLRPHVAAVGRALDRIAGPELAERVGQARRLLHHDGAIYTTSGVHQPWVLDPVPLVVQSDEWAEVERGLVQRARLLDALLVDLYGERSVLERGLLPPAVVFGHEGYLRPVAGTAGSGKRLLMMTAVDLARRPDGTIVALGDRTQSPTGAGYALENRRAMNQVFPSLFRGTQVRRLAGWFHELQLALARLAPDGDGRVVVLTPGAASPAYFEHAFLATNLGYPLVEGADLTVRSGRVWLRSLGGLEPVDVILRRVDDMWCDPLELRGDSWLGVAGLVEASRRGTVAIVNPLGSAVLENPGLGPFLGGLCRGLLGEDLVLEGVASWWCGDPASRSDVLARLPELVLKPISPSANTAEVVSGRRGPDGIGALAQMVKTEPWRWVAEERLAPARMPSVGHEGLEPRPVLLRAQLVATPDSWAVLPGGLVRVGRHVDEVVVSNRIGASSKDAWVLATEPDRQVGLWSARPSVDLDERAIPSRTSENLFWMARYAERAEGTIRLSRVILDRLDDPEILGDRSERAWLEAALGAVNQVTGNLEDGEADIDDFLTHPEATLVAVLTSASDPGALTPCLRNLLRAANGARDRLSSDTWRVVSDVESDLAALHRLRPNIAAVRDICDHLRRALLALAGLAQESMVRDAGWRLLDSGRRFERSSLVCAVTRRLLVPPADDRLEPMLLESFLASSESLVAYRRRSRSRLAAAAALDLVLAEASNPRSLRYQLDRLVENLAALPRADDGDNDLLRGLVADALQRVDDADTATLARRDPTTGRRQALDELMVDVEALLDRASEALADRFFAHHRAERRLATGPIGTRDRRRPTT